MVICFVYENLPTVLLMFFNKLASCPVPNIDLHFSLQMHQIVSYQIWGSSQLGLGDHVYFSLDLGEIVPKFTLNMIHKKEKRELVLTNFAIN